MRRERQRWGLEETSIEYWTDAQREIKHLKHTSSRIDKSIKDAVLTKNRKKGLDENHGQW